MPATPSCARCSAVRSARLAVEDASHGHQRPKVEVRPHAVRGDETARAARGRAENGEVAIFVGGNRALGAQQQQPAGLPRRARALRASSPTLPGLRLRALRADGCSGGSLLPGARRARDRLEAASSLEDIEAASSMLRRAPLLGVRKAAAARDAGRVCPHAPLALFLARDRRHPRHDRHRHPGQPVDGRHRRVGNHQTARRLGARSSPFRPRLAGIWGMNFEHMPRAEMGLGLPMALTLIASAAGILFWRFRRAVAVSAGPPARQASSAAPRWRRSPHISSSTMPRLSGFQAMPLTKRRGRAGQVEHLARHPAAQRHAEQRAHQHRADARAGSAGGKCSRTMIAYEGTMPPWNRPNSADTTYSETSPSKGRNSSSPCLQHEPSSSVRMPPMRSQIRRRDQPADDAGSQHQRQHLRAPRAANPDRRSRRRCAPAASTSPRSRPRRPRTAALRLVHRNPKGHQMEPTPYVPPRVTRRHPAAAGGRSRQRASGITTALTTPSVLVCRASRYWTRCCTMGGQIAPAT